ncbi:Kelch Domain-Containing Protein 3 [Manis pentadactyla]|nr:Kelch Domain-Containing Protein 3 [Manis pentadactyla]
MPLCDPSPTGVKMIWFEQPRHSRKHSRFSLVVLSGSRTKGIELEISIIDHDLHLFIRHKPQLNALCKIAVNMEH